MTPHTLHTGKQTERRTCGVKLQEFGGWMLSSTTKLIIVLATFWCDWIAWSPKSGSTSQADLWGITSVAPELQVLIKRWVVFLTSNMESQAVIWLCREAMFWLSLMSGMSTIRESTTFIINLSPYIIPSIPLLLARIKWFCLRSSGIFKQTLVLVGPAQLHSH